MSLVVPQLTDMILKHRELCYFLHDARLPVIIIVDETVLIVPLIQRTATVPHRSELPLVGFIVLEEIATAQKGLYIIQHFMY